jgi:seryl-tRNA synthetase
LREQPDAIRKGAIDKGEDSALVDAALTADARRRELQGEADGLRAERNTVSKEIGESIKGGAKPDGPEVAGLRT